jgi:hypothetical protein
MDSKRLSESVIFYVVEIAGAPRGASAGEKSRAIVGQGHKSRKDAAAKAKKMAQNNPGNRYYVTETVSGFRRSNLVSYKRYDA